MLLFRWIRRRVTNAHAFKTLSKLDERNLRDIDVRKSEIERARILPFWKDPALEVSKMANERRTREDRPIGFGRRCCKRK